MTAVSSAVHGYAMFVVNVNDTHADVLMFSECVGQAPEGRERRRPSVVGSDVFNERMTKLDRPVAVVATADHFAVWLRRKRWAHVDHRFAETVLADWLTARECEHARLNGQDIFCDVMFGGSQSDLHLVLFGRDVDHDSWYGIQIVDNLVLVRCPLLGGQ